MSSTRTSPTFRRLTKENELNKLIKDQKASGSKEFVVFVSLWDPVSLNLLKAIEENPSRKSITLVNSFDTPHSFVIWGLSKAPALVILEGSGYSKKLIITDHVTDIYKRLGLER